MASDGRLPEAELLSMTVVARLHRSCGDGHPKSLASGDESADAQRRPQLQWCCLRGGCRQAEPLEPGVAYLLGHSGKHC
jgi:hypothetical protein